MTANQVKAIEARVEQSLLRPWMDNPTLAYDIFTQDIPQMLEAIRILKWDLRQARIRLNANGQNIAGVLG